MRNGCQHLQMMYYISTLSAYQLTPRGDSLCFIPSRGSTLCHLFMFGQDKYRLTLQPMEYSHYLRLVVNLACNLLPKVLLRFTSFCWCCLLPFKYTIQLCTNGISILLEAFMFAAILLCMYDFDNSCQARYKVNCLIQYSVHCIFLICSIYHISDIG